MWRFVLLGGLSLQPLTILPFYVGALGDELGFGSVRAGVLEGGEIAGFSLAGLLVFALLGRIAWRWAVPLLVLGCAAANLCCLGVEAFVPLFILRLATGVCAGGLYAFALAAMGRATMPERLFGQCVALQSVLAVLVLVAVPRLLEGFGIGALYPLMAGLVLACLPLAAHLPQPAAPAMRRSAAERPPQALPLILGGLALFYAAQGALWAFVERIGQAAGLGGGAIGEALAVATVVGVGGGLLAARQGRRWGLRLPLVLTFAAQAVALGLLWGGGYLAGVSLFNLFWNYAFAFQLGLLSGGDPGRRAVALAPLAQGVGMAAGAALGGMALGGAALAGAADAGRLYLLVLLLGLGSLVAVLRPASSSQRPGFPGVAPALASAPAREANR